MSIFVDFDAADRSDPFRELVLYIAGKTADDDRFGDTHLNKVLFFADALALQHLGSPITNAEYLKMENGPIARPLLPARHRLVEDGDARVVEPQETYDFTLTYALREPNLDLFTEEQLELVDEMIDRFQGKTAREVSDMAHKFSPGWNAVDLRETIPLDSQFVSRAAASESALDRARALAAQFDR